MPQLSQDDTPEPRKMLNNQPRTTMETEDRTRNQRVVRSDPRLRNRNDDEGTVAASFPDDCDQFQPGREER